MRVHHVNASVDTERSEALDEHAPDVPEVRDPPEAGESEKARDQVDVMPPPSAVSPGTSLVTGSLHRSGNSALPQLL